MDKLEQYIDQVCKSIGGPPDLRQHVRQELREHLLDAVAQHQAAGMTEAEAVIKALDEFGKPDEVRSELEGTHGRRMGWLIEKAMQWKEITLKGKWLWTTWAHLSLLSVIALDVLYLVFLEREPRSIDEAYAIYLAPPTLVFWGWFEWRVRSENKSFMRLSALGTTAVGLTLVMMLASGDMIAFRRHVLPNVARSWAIEQITKTDAAVQAMEAELPGKNWDSLESHSIRAIRSLNTLINASDAIPSLNTSSQPSMVVSLVNSADRANGHLRAAHIAIHQKDDQAAAAALRDFRWAFEDLREAAKRPAR